MNKGETFNRMSDDPEWWEFGPEERSKVDDFIKRFNLRPGDRVLEPGCGTGRFSELLAATVGPNGRVLACDTSPAMIAQARTRRLGAAVEFACAPVLEAGAAGPWDAIVCFNVLPHLLPIAEHLRTMRGWMRPGASLWICHSASRQCINDIHAEAGTRWISRIDTGPWEEPGHSPCLRRPRRHPLRRRVGRLRTAGFQDVRFPGIASGAGCD